MADQLQQQYQYRPQQHQTDNYEKNYFQTSGPSTSKILVVATLVPVGGTLLALAGLSLVGTLIGLAMATPLFLLFSPVLVPAAFVIGCSIAGFLTSGAFGITGISSLSWIANFLRGARSYKRQPFDQGKRLGQEAAGQLGQRTRDVGQRIQNKSQESGRASQGSEGGRDQESGRTQEAGKK